MCTLDTYYLVGFCLSDKKQVIRCLPPRPNLNLAVRRALLYSVGA